MTRSDLIRIVMGRAVQDRPDWLGLPPAPDDVAPDFASNKDALSNSPDAPKPRR